jgi:hypothetical protein
MSERPVDMLVERIDAALARIERAAARRQQEMSALEGRHERLKASAGDILGEIDALLDQTRP